MQEWVAIPNSGLIGRSATAVELRTRYRVNLLAISRSGQRTINRLKSAPIQAGDVLLLQGAGEAIADFAADFGCLPLAARELRMPSARKALLASLAMISAVIVAGLGLLPVSVAVALAAFLFVVLKIVPTRTLYGSIDWSVIVLLGSMIPVASAMESTGLAQVLANSLLSASPVGSPWVALSMVLVLTMVLTDFMNNAATAAVMCPIAIGLAVQLGVNQDAFLMAVAVGSSSSFMTPIGHQNNTLILGPGGFRFGDYWRLGLMVELIVAAVAIPTLMYFWPL
jgi:di/tricarboxylate transporter